MIKKFILIFLLSFYYAIIQSFVNDYFYQIAFSCLLALLYKTEISFKHLAISLFLSMIVVIILDPFQWISLQQFSAIFQIPSALSLFLVLIVTIISLAVPPYLLCELIRRFNPKSIQVI